MSGNRFNYATGSVTLSTSAKTVAQVLAASNHGVNISQIDIDFDKVGDTLTGKALVEVLYQTTAGTMTAVTAAQTLDSSDTVQSTGSKNATAEPTAGNVIQSEYVDVLRSNHIRITYLFFSAN